MTSFCFGMVSPAPFVISALLALSLVSADPNAPCYNPGGKRIDGFYPCDPTAFITMCCPQGWTCFSDSLCVVATTSHAFPNLTLGAVQRAGCTNPLWVNNICGDKCLDDANVAGDMVACGGDKFCCGGDYQATKCDCSSTGSAAPFTIDVGRPLTIVGVTDTKFTGSPTYLTVPPSRTPATKTTSATATPSLNSTSSASGSSATGGPTETGGGSPADTAPADNSSGGSSNVALKAGVGAGVSVAVIAAAFALGYVFWWRRRDPYGRGPLYGPADDVAEDRLRINRGVNQHWDPTYASTSTGGAAGAAARAGTDDATGPYFPESRTNIPAVAPLNNPYDNRKGASAERTEDA